MSRLDSMIRRLSAQRDGLSWATGVTAGIGGDVLEIGLGNGRTYDHLRELLPQRRIWVIDRQLSCHPACIPPKSNFLQGEAADMLQNLSQTPHKIALAHYDFGIGIDEKDRNEAEYLSPLIAQTMCSGGIIVSSQPLIGFSPLPAPETIPPNRYFFYHA